MNLEYEKERQSLKSRGGREREGRERKVVKEEEEKEERKRTFWAVELYDECDAIFRPISTALYEMFFFSTAIFDQDNWWPGPWKWHTIQAIQLHISWSLN